MRIALHKNARTTPASRAEIASSTDSVVALVMNHLLTLDHCATLRAAVRQMAVAGGWVDRVWVLEDGESRAYA